VHELAARSATVLVHGRDAAKGKATLRDLREATGNEGLDFLRADLGSLGQVRELAERVLAEHDRLDVLVNNAGIGTGRGGEREVSDDGYELRFAVNYLAAFLLTRLLEPLLVRTAGSRIVNVSSAGQAPIRFDDVMLERRYDPVQAYGQSKLALVMLTFDLAEELPTVTANCLHPGTFMPTKMVLEAGVSPVDSLESGVEATMRLVADPDLNGVTGRYFQRMREATAHPQAYDADARRRLRELSAELVGVS
jgi:NAD(P)-dependent dehydrogenase (short-subunit alcohol dehydrogenase family)